MQNVGIVISRHNIDIVLGDFNINYLNDTDSQHLKELMTSYEYIQIVHSPTFVSAGSLLDHVFVKMDVTKKYAIDHLVKTVYYSDHDAVQVALTLS